MISIHALLAESDLCAYGLKCGISISIHALFALPCRPSHFYPRSPCGERRLCPVCQWRRSLISIHALLAESDHADFDASKSAKISIHALLAESDAGAHDTSRTCYEFLSTLSLRRATIPKGYVGMLKSISIHALLAESDKMQKNTKIKPLIFLSTLSLRRATLGAAESEYSSSYFYPRSPCGERHYFSGVMRQNPGISIHALLAESDNRPVTMHTWKKVFLSTLSLRRATICVL